MPENIVADNPRADADGAGGALPVLCLLVPCYNEEAIIADSLARMTAKMDEWRRAGMVADESFCCFVDDGSADNTWALLAQHLQAPHRALKLAFNAGHQNALHAGISHIKDACDCCVSIDADLQDDMDAVPLMLAARKRGAAVVYGVREERGSDSFFKRNTARLFYRLSSVLGVPGRAHHADFRLTDKLVMRALAAFDERHLYWRGLLPSLGFRAETVEYARSPRIGGETKYPAGKMLLLAFNGITSFSVMPLRIIMLLGLMISAAAMLGGAWFFVNTLFYGGEWPQGWASLIISLYFLGGIILMSLGIIGEYVGKIFIESKKRPLYVVEKTRQGGVESASQ
ncbi:MAG: glycosyltransferase family 2 protein [Gammaproteobacteria bacterium]